MKKYFWRLRKKNNYFAAIELKKVIPELRRKSSDEISEYLKHCTLQFYELEKAPVLFWMRFTMPFAILVAIIFFLALPFNYLITGRWGYKFAWLTNWFKAVGLF